METTENQASEGNQVTNVAEVSDSLGSQGQGFRNGAYSQENLSDGKNAEEKESEKAEASNEGGTFLSGIQKRAKDLKDQVKNSDLFSQTKSESFRKNSRKVDTDLRKISKNWQRLAQVKEFTKKEFITSRKKESDDVIKYRRGPIDVKMLPVSNRNLNRTTHGTIDSDDEDGRSCRPSSKGLLTYFKELGQSGDDNEKVDLSFINSLFEAGADVNHQDRYGQTSLHAIARDWHTNVAKYFLERGALIDRADKYGRTPLHLAAAVDHHEMVEFLVLNGANVDEKSLSGQTPLHFASKNGAVETIKCMIRLGAQINAKDNNLRTPLFLAAESGRAHVARTLLDHDAPAGTYDNKGTSAMAHMVEKMPQVAYAALAQFYMDDKAIRRKYFYLNQLESEKNQVDSSKNFAKSALEMIVVYKETELVMHPVIQKLIDVKWNLFARKRCWIELIINLIFTMIWLALAVAIPRDGKFHTPVGEKAWRIVLESVFIIMSICFVIQEAVTSRKMYQIDRKWREWKVRNLENELENCHPKWPDERKYVESEIERLWKFRGTYSRNMLWSIYEWTCHASILATAATEVYYEFNPSNMMAKKLFSIVICISVTLICLRLMKICRAFTFLSAFIVLLGHVVGATLKFAFLFFEFFIPYVCILWIIYGGSENAKKIDKVFPGKGKEFETFGDVVYITWLMTVTADIPFSAMVQYERQLSMIIVGTYYSLVSVVCINLYIALMSETFTRVYENAEANASLQQALRTLFIERQLSSEENAKMRNHFRTNCSPLEQCDHNQPGVRLWNLERETVIVLGNVERQLTTLSGMLEGKEENKAMDEGETEKVQKLVNDVKIKCRTLRKNQGSFLKEMQDSLDEVTKAQGNVMKILKAIALRAPRTEGKGQVKLRRSISSQSIG